MLRRLDGGVGRSPLRDWPFGVSKAAAFGTFPERFDVLTVDESFSGLEQR